VVQENDPHGSVTRGTEHQPAPADGACDAARDEFPESVCIAAIAGDHEALHRLWHHNRRWVAAILLAHKPRWADLEDLLQEVALAVVRKLGEVRDPRAIRPWLRTVAMNAAHAAARSGRRRARDQALADPDALEQPFVRRDPAGPPDQLGEAEVGKRLLELARKLPDGYREPLLLKAVHNLSYREIGEILGMPETTVETRIARGRRQLRDLAMAALTPHA
jgi:RNA polymerase sigma-70 factor (ECF subfamily)